MRRVTCALLAGSLAALLGGCSGDEPEDPGDPATSPPAPRPQIGSWTALADFPQKRLELSAVALDGLVYVAGGFTQGPGGDVFYRYDPESDTWSELAPIPELRHHAPLAAYDGTVYLVGGYALTGGGPFDNPTDTLFVYDVAADRWRQGPSLPEPVAAHAVATTDDGMIHLVGGIGEEAIAGRDEHLVFDTATGTWSTLPPMPSGREHLGAAYLDGVVYAAAGRMGGGGDAFEAYDTRTRQWTTLPDLPTPRSGVAMVAFQGQLYVVGGETLNGTFDHAERFDLESGTWQEVTPMPSPRHGLGGVALGDGIVMIGGGPTVSFSYSADVEIWRP